MSAPWRAGRQPTLGHEPAAVGHRHRITMEDILRDRPGRGELTRALRLIAAEVPRPRRDLVALVALAAGEVAGNVAVALAVRAVIAGAAADEPTVPTAWVVVAVVGALVAFALTRWRQVFGHDLVLRCRTRAVRRVAHRLNEAAYDDLAAVPMAALREILMTDIDLAYRFAVDAINKVVVIGLWSLAALAIVAWLSPVLLVVLVVLGIGGVVLVLQSLRRHGELTGDRFLRLADLSQRARELVEVERVVLARQLGLGTRFVDSMLDSHARYVEVLGQQQRLTATLRATLVGVNGLAFVAVVAVGAVLLRSGDLDFGALVAILFVVSQLLLAVSDLGDYVQRGAETITAGRRLGAYWHADHDPAGPSTAVTVDTSTTPVRRVSGRDLRFAYASGPDVLGGLDVELERGRLACLTGATGAGKTTLALVLTGVLEPTGGHVDIDGVPLAGRASPPMLYIGPRPVLVEGSVLDNLLVDTDEVDLDRLGELFGALPGPPLPLDAPIISSHGTGISSGQGQLVALARAWVRDPDVVVFDEATSSLDMASEARVQELLLGWATERVTLAISHRRCPWVDRAEARLSMRPGVGG